MCRSTFSRNFFCYRCRYYSLSDIISILPIIYKKILQKTTFLFQSPFLFTIYLCFVYTFFPAQKTTNIKSYHDPNGIFLFNLNGLAFKTSFSCYSPGNKSEGKDTWVFQNCLLSSFTIMIAILSKWWWLWLQYSPFIPPTTIIL